MKTYIVNEIFLSLQGEGARVGTLNVFIRFSRCNLACVVPTQGFDCDTEFVSGRAMTADEIMADVCALVPPERRYLVGIILTGGEPLLQADDLLCASLRRLHFDLLCVETNGTIRVPDDIQYVVVSPKSAEHTIRAGRANELRYVRRHGQGIPLCELRAAHCMVSPAFGPEGLDRRDLEWCIHLVHENPAWRLTMQYHKVWGVR